jgi:glutathione S-transferase
MTRLLCYAFGIYVGNAASHFLSLEANYPAVMGWCDRILERPAVLRGLRVCEWSKEYSKPWELKKDAIK